MSVQLSSRLRSMKFMKRKEAEEKKPEQKHAYSSASVSSCGEEGIEAVVVDETNISVLGPEPSLPSFQGRSSFLKFNPRLESILSELRKSFPQNTKAGTDSFFKEDKRERLSRHQDKVDIFNKKRRKIDVDYEESLNKATA